jgi:hypothetical protein
MTTFCRRKLPNNKNRLAFGKPQLATPDDSWIIAAMSAQEMLAEEIKRQPEPVLCEVLHYLHFLTRQRDGIQRRRF